MVNLPSIHHKYVARPDALAEMCMAEFVANYTTVSQTEAVSGEISVDVEVDDTLTRHTIKLKECMGKMPKRKFIQVIRYHFVTKEKDMEKYFQRLMSLYQPWKKTKMACSRMAHTEQHSVM